MLNNPIKNRYEFVAVYELISGISNSSPDSSGMQRIDPETGHGIMTDVCQKRKLRDYVDMVKNRAPGYDIYIKRDSTLNSSDRAACTALNIGSDKEALIQAKKDDPEIDRKIRDWLCANYFDIRTFGGVMTTFTKAGLNCGQIRGPVQMAFAESVDPVAQIAIALTRVAITTDSDALTKNTELGNKYIVPYGLFVAHGYVDANLAEKTGFSEDDLNLLWDALLNMYEHDHSAMRGEMSTRKLIVFKHDSAIGNAPAFELFSSVKIAKKPGVEVPRKFEDYDIVIPTQAEMPAGVTIEVKR